jgi:hypothetical protein
VDLNVHLTRWSGNAFRHLPAGPRFDVLDFRTAGQYALNRWNVSGEPTLYLAGDEGVLIAEWGRHFQVDRPPDLRSPAVERAVYRLSLTIDRVLDLRSPEVWRLLSLQDAPGCFADRSLARATATYIRRTTSAQALLVPPIAFLDQPDRWNLVLFLEKLPAPADFVTAVEPLGPLRFGP